MRCSPLKCKRNKNELAARRAFVANNDLTGEIHMPNVTRRAAGSLLFRFHFNAKPNLKSWHALQSPSARVFNSA